MTENKAKILLCQMHLPQFVEEEKQALTMVIQALEEIQQYRAIGTVEGYENAIKAYTETYILMKEYKSKLQDFEEIGTVEELKSLKESNLTAMEMADIWCVLEDLKKYSAIGTTEEFKALKEKSEPKKPILNNPKINDFYVKEAKLCPSCHSYINNCSGDYCRDCGQRIDWSK